MRRELSGLAEKTDPDASKLFTFAPAVAFNASAGQSRGGGAGSSSDGLVRLPEITQALYDLNEKVQQEATREFRKLLAIERNLPIPHQVAASHTPI